MDDALALLQQYSENIWIIEQNVINDISSTKVRLFFKKVRLPHSLAYVIPKTMGYEAQLLTDTCYLQGLSVRYLIPDEVINYARAHGLFQDQWRDTPGSSSRDEQGTTTSAVPS